MPSRTKKFAYRLLTWIGPWLVRLLGYTIRVERVNSDVSDDLIKQKKPFIFCLWHGRLFLPVFYNRGRGAVAMVSRHADGELIAQIVHKLGYGTVRGSSGRGGHEAFLQLLSHLKGGGLAAMIPDGPLGPAYEFKLGTVVLAKQSGCPLVPITYAASSYWKLNTWDQTILPKPFSRAVIYYGNPLLVPAEATPAELEGYRVQIQTAMNEAVRAAEAYMNKSSTPKSR